MSGTQKALFIESKQGPLKLGRRSIPIPGPGQLLVRVEAAGLNPADWKIQKYGLILETYPAIVGSDIAGVVESVAEGVNGFTQGDRVFFAGAWGGDKAGFQQYALAEAKNTAKIPPQLSFEEGAAIPVALATALIGLYLPKPYGMGLLSPLDSVNRGRYAGKPLVIIGGATSVGQYVIQSAKLSGFSPIIATASLKHSEYLRSIGATHVLDRNLDNATIAAEISKIFPSPIEIIFDTVSSPDTQETGYSLLSPGGTIAVLLPNSVTPVEGKEIINVVGLLTLPFSCDLGLQLYSQLEELLDAGSIKPLKVEVVPGGLNGVPKGLAKLEADKVSGVKLVVQPQETV
ncbi:hypothetical protein H0H81_002480 [Sphagnurus paluster]|uniref:Enoyl reductase (ER) domain-containing protein n=1 Tax=Sphagnurus paluster TaxID=117069 RepID=A0A9P7FSU0_9AGAR|nr:hypothetical protein H0H81_002480 [Sphagnurus paluster]